MILKKYRKHLIFFVIALSVGYGAMHFQFESDPYQPRVFEFINANEDVRNKVPPMTHQRTGGSGKLGIALSTLHKLPLNALRHPAQNGTCGWYVWGGEEFSYDDDFFSPSHVEHLASHCPQIIPFLGLPAGWRVLLANEYEDVWFNEKLLAL